MLIEQGSHLNLKPWGLMLEDERGNVQTVASTYIQRVPDMTAVRTWGRITGQTLEPYKWPTIWRTAVNFDERLLSDSNLRRKTIQVFETTLANNSNEMVLADTYTLLLSLENQGYRRPNNAPEPFYQEIEILSGTPRDKFFSPWLYHNYLPDTGIFPDCPPPVIGNLGYPPHTLILDYAYEAYIPDCPHREFNSDVYKAFLALLKENHNFNGRVSWWLNENIEKGYATHPDFLGAINALCPLPTPATKDSLNIYSQTYETIREIMTCQPWSNLWDRLYNELSSRLVYTTTVPGRYSKFFGHLFTHLFAYLPELIKQQSAAVMDYGSGSRCYGLESFISSAQKNGIKVAQAAGVDPNFEPQKPESLQEVEFNSITGSIGITSKNFEKVFNWLNNHQDCWVIALNTVIPHFAELDDFLYSLFFYHPRVIIFYGGFFDYVGPINQGREIHVLLRQKISQPESDETKYGYKLLRIPMPP